MRKTYFVYAKDVNRIKIGESSDPLRRLSELQASCPCYLLLLKATAAVSEASCHARFSGARWEHEWFDATPELLNFVESLPAEGL